MELHTSTSTRQEVNIILGRFRLAVTNDDKALETSRIVEQIKASRFNEPGRVGGPRVRWARTNSTTQQPSFSRALDEATDKASRADIVRDAATHEASLNRLAELRTGDATFHALLARHFRELGQDESAAEVAGRARALYEQRLAAEPSNSKLAAGLADVLRELVPTQWEVLAPTEKNSEAGVNLATLDDGSILARGRNTAQDVYTISAQTDRNSVSAIRLEALTDDSLPSGGPGRGIQGQFVLDRLEVSVSPQADTESLEVVPFSAVTADYHLESQPMDPLRAIGTSWAGRGAAALPISSLRKRPPPTRTQDCNFNFGWFSITTPIGPG